MSDTFYWLRQFSKTCPASRGNFIEIWQSSKRAHEAGNTSVTCFGSHEWQNQNFNPGLLTPNPVLSPLYNVPSNFINGLPFQKGPALPHKGRSPSF
jgi:hypothetical protein